MDVRMKFVQQIIFSIAVLIVFSDLGNPLTNGQAAIQNREGVLFFLITMQVNEIGIPLSATGQRSPPRLSLTRYDKPRPISKGGENFK